MAETIFAGVQFHLDTALETERAWLVRLCATLSGDSNAAEDLAQETMLEVWRHKQKLSDPDGFRAWVAAIARNICLRWRRTKGRDAQHNTQHDATFLEETIADTADLEITLEHDELATLLDRALALLPAETRAVLIARYIHETPLSEVAQRLGLTENALSVRLHRGKLALHRILTTDLQAETAAFAGDLPRDVWHETRIWCAICGRHTLVGQLPQATGTFSLRCPACNTEPDSYLTHTTNATWLEGVKGFKATLNRQMKWATAFDVGALENRGARCEICGNTMDLSLEMPANLSQPVRRGRGIYHTCSACGNDSRSSLDGVALFTPQGQRFWQQHERIYVLPQREIEVEGQPAIHVSFGSIRNSASLNVIFARDTYRVLRVDNSDA